MLTETLKMAFMASNDHYHQGEQVYCGQLIFAGINKADWVSGCAKLVRCQENARRCCRCKCYLMHYRSGECLFVPVHYWVVYICIDFSQKQEKGKSRWWVCVYCWIQIRAVQEIKKTAILMEIPIRNHFITDSGGKYGKWNKNIW